MKARRWMIAGLLGVVAVPNYLMLHHAQRETQGIEAFLELAPADPRSLMQGDYMRLNYSLARHITSPGRGKIVVHLDENRVLRGGAPLTGTLKPGEMPLSYYSDQGRPTVGPTSYMFPEGQGEVFQRARYARIRLLPEGDTVLIGLADAQREELRPGSAPKTPPGKSGVATIPQEYLEQRDHKPPLSCLAKVQLKPGLNLLSEGFFYLHGGNLECVRWESIQRIRETRTSISIFTEDSQDDTRAEKEEILIQSSEIKGNITSQMVSAAGLTLDQRGESYFKEYRRQGRKPQPPQKPVHAPGKEPAVSPIMMSLSDLAHLPKGLGVFLTPTGLAICEPYRISSISWDNCRFVEAREAEGGRYSRGNCSVFLCATRQGSPAHSNAIRLDGPVGVSGAPYLNSQDFAAALSLLRGTRPPQSRSFPLYSIDPKAGPARSQADRKTVLEKVTLTRLDGVWPGKVMRDVKQVRCGVYLLPDGLLQVTRDTLSYTPWSKIEQASVGVDGAFSATAEKHEFKLEPKILEEIPRFRALSQELLTLLNFRLIDGEREISPEAVYLRQPGQEVRRPSEARFFPADVKEPSVWSGPGLHSLGAEALDPGVHFTQEGILFATPATVEGVRWEALRRIRRPGRDDRQIFMDGGEVARQFPEGYDNALPPTLWASAWKVLPEYWTIDAEMSDGDDTHGRARPQRPATPRHFLVRDYR